MTKHQLKQKKDKKREERAALKQFRNLYSQPRKKKELDRAFGRMLWFCGNPTYSLKVSLYGRVIWRGSLKDFRMEDISGFRAYPPRMYE